MNLRLKIDAILLVVGPGLVGEREVMFLVITPGLDITFGSTTIWDGSISTLETSTSDLDSLGNIHIKHIITVGSLLQYLCFFFG
jgi:hypothetical protein